MIAFPSILAAYAEEAGIKVPENPDSYEPMEFKKFHLFCCAQLGQPMPSPSSGWENAKVIAELPDELVETVTMGELTERGFAIGYPLP